MKNLEVSFSLVELKFKCKNLFLMWEKHLADAITPTSLPHAKLSF